MICLLLSVLDEFHFQLKWYQSKCTRETQPLSGPTFFNLKSGREESQGKSSRESDCFLIRAILMVEKYMHENLKHTVTKHVSKKIKKYFHFQTITTNNRKHFFRFYIKKADAFIELLPNNTTDFSRHQTILTKFILSDTDIFRGFLTN